MAGDWFKIKSDLHKRIEFLRIMSDCNLSKEKLLFALYEIARYFQVYGDHGILKSDPRLIDQVVDIDGISSALIRENWMRFENGVTFLRVFVDVSTIRKSIGDNTRKDVLSGGVCAACGTDQFLTVDHIVPVSRGGSSERHNLQALCETCNRKKGKRTMEEFLRDR